MRVSSVFNVVALLLLSATSFAQQDWLDPWREATVALGVVDTAKAISKETGKYIIRHGDTVRIPYFKVAGTAVIFGSPDTSIRIPFLITAKHVLDDPKKNWHPSSLRLRFTWFAHRSVTEYLGIEIKLKDTSGNMLWVAHPSDAVDLAMMPLVISIRDAGRATGPVVPFELLAQPSEVFEGASILVFGYPGAVGADYWTKPIIRHGIIAHVDQAHFGSVPLLVDAMIFPGNSGGPVFTVPTGLMRDGSFSVGGRNAFLGIVTAVAKQLVEVEKASYSLQPIRRDSLETHFKSFDYMGLGIIEPAQRVKELLRLVKR